MNHTRAPGPSINIVKARSAPKFSPERGRTIPPADSAAIACAASVWFLHVRLWSVASSRFPSEASPECGLRQVDSPAEAAWPQLTLHQHLLRQTGARLGRFPWFTSDRVVYLKGSRTLGRQAAPLMPYTVFFSWLHSSKPWLPTVVPRCGEGGRLDEPW